MSKGQSYFDDLCRVTTVPTVADLWGVCQTTVVYHIMRENIVAVKDGNIWIVSLQSVIDLWGIPRNLLVYEPQTPVDVLLDQYKAS